MKILPSVVAAAENRKPVGVTAKEKPKQPFEADSFALIGPGASPAVDAALARRVANLALGGARPSATELERLMGSNDLVDEFYLQRALIAAQPVMRITLRDAASRERGWATGFMVSPRLLLTNWHVFPALEETSNAICEANYVLDVTGNPVPSHRFAIRGDLFYQSHDALDFALVAVDPLAQDGRTPLTRFGYHRLLAQPNKIREAESMTIIQHPGGERRQISIRENRLSKILDQFLWYQSDTAPGSSGAPAFNDSFQVVALHHSGAARRDENGFYLLRDGTAVASLDGVDDSQIDWVANEGLRISVLCEFFQGRLQPGSPFIDELFQAMQGGDVLSVALGGGGLPAIPQVEQGTGLPIVVQPGAVITVPIHLQIMLSPVGGVPGALPQAGAGSTTQVVTAGQEALRYPIVDRDYTRRSGYKSSFLGISVPLPTVTDRTQVARTSNGGYLIPYEHFTVVVNKLRRLPLFTAANLDYSAALRQPEPGDYSRKGLCGLKEGDSEKWLTDPRIPEQDQLPDVFYTKDGGSFDKGHVVRREDVCWGTTRAQIVRANGDTFHVTNCTPQIAGFNQASRGIVNWGDLEDEIQRQAKTERLSIFAGPILSEDDPVFEGRDELGPVSIQIPRRYWKVVLAKERSRLAAYAFILQQDLTALPVEFSPTAAWTPYLVSLAALQAQLKGLAFAKKVLAADRSGQDGRELARSIGAELHPSLGSPARMDTDRKLV